MIVVANHQCDLTVKSGSEAANQLGRGETGRWLVRQRSEWPSGLMIQPGCPTAVANRLL
ncbi:MAG: hypothetical protein AB7I37_26610 [Pirellulales bacterium]